MMPMGCNANNAACPSVKKMKRIYSLCLFHGFLLNKQTNIGYSLLFDRRVCDDDEWRLHSGRRLLEHQFDVRQWSMRHASAKHAIVRYVVDEQQRHAMSEWLAVCSRRMLANQQHDATDWLHCNWPIVSSCKLKTEKKCDNFGSLIFVVPHIEYDVFEQWLLHDAWYWQWQRLHD